MLSHIRPCFEKVDVKVVFVFGSSGFASSVDELMTIPKLRDLNALASPCSLIFSFGVRKSVPTPSDCVRS